MASQPETGVVAGGQPGDRLPGPDPLAAHLEAAGYDRDGHSHRWFLPSRDSVLSVVIWPIAVNVHAFGPPGAHRWSARFGEGTPAAAVVAFLEAAEKEMNHG